MVSRNLGRIASEFDDMVEERDWQGFIALGGIGALGGVLAEMFHDRVAPRLNQPSSPTGARGLGVSFAIKAAAAAILGMAAVRMSGDIALALGVLGVGAMVDAGVDLLEAGDTLRNASPAVSGSSTNRPQPRRARPAQQSSPSRSRSKAGSTAPSGSLLAQV